MQLPGINHGTPPPAAAQFVTGVHVPTPRVSPESPRERRLTMPGPVVLEEVSGAGPRRQETVQVVLAATDTMTGFRLSMEVEDISIGEFWISLLNPSSHFEPTGAMSLTLVLRGRDYPVKFLGGVFSFPTRNLEGISFLRMKTSDLA